MWRSPDIRRVIDENLGYVGGGLACLVGGIHLFHPQRGFPRFITILSTGDLSLFLYDPRPVVFVLSAIAIWLGITLAMWEIARKPVYVVGMLLMATYFLGYFAWHLSGHGGFLPIREPHYHGLNPVEAVVSHLYSYPIAAISKIAESALFGVLVILYGREE